MMQTNSVDSMKAVINNRMQMPALEALQSRLGIPRAEVHPRIVLVRQTDFIDCAAINIIIIIIMYT